MQRTHRLIATQQLKAGRAQKTSWSRWLAAAVVLGAGTAAPHAAHAQTEGTGMVQVELNIEDIKSVNEFLGKVAVKDPQAHIEKLKEIWQRWGNGEALEDVDTRDASKFTRLMDLIRTKLSPNEEREVYGIGAVAKAEGVAKIVPTRKNLIDPRLPETPSLGQTTGTVTIHAELITQFARNLGNEKAQSLGDSMASGLLAELSPAYGGTAGARFHGTEAWSILNTALTQSSAAQFRQMTGLNPDNPAEMAQINGILGALREGRIEDALNVAPNSAFSSAIFRSVANAFNGVYVNVPVVQFAVGTDKTFFEGSDWILSANLLLRPSFVQRFKPKIEKVTQEDGTIKYDMKIEKEKDLAALGFEIGGSAAFKLKEGREIVGRLVLERPDPGIAKIDSIGTLVGRLEIGFKDKTGELTIPWTTIPIYPAARLVVDTTGKVKTVVEGAIGVGSPFGVPTVLTMSLDWVISQGTLIEIPLAVKGGALFQGSESVQWGLYGLGAVPGAELLGRGSSPIQAGAYGGAGGVVRFTGIFGESDRLEAAVEAGIQNVDVNRSRVLDQVAGLVSSGEKRPLALFKLQYSW